MLTYQIYEAQMRGFGKDPMSEAEFNKMQGIEIEAEIPCLLSPKFTRLKAVKPTIEEHEKRVKL